MAKTNDIDTQGTNQLNAGTTVNGDIQTEGNIRIDGVLNGSLTSKGKVVVGPTGKVEGDIVCANADVSGTLKARITVSELLTLKSTANLLGDLVTNRLVVEDGASFTGKAEMGAVVKDINLSEKQGRKEKSA